MGDALLDGLAELEHIVINRAEARSFAKASAVLQAARQEIMRLRANDGRMRECLRVNLLRHVPDITHADIDAKLAEIEEAQKAEPPAG